MQTASMPKRRKNKWEKITRKVRHIAFLVRLGSSWRQRHTLFAESLSLFLSSRLRFTSSFDIRTKARRKRGQSLTQLAAKLALICNHLSVFLQAPLFVFHACTKYRFVPLSFFVSLFYHDNLKFCIYKTELILNNCHYFVFLYLLYL